MAISLSWPLTAALATSLFLLSCGKRPHQPDAAADSAPSGTNAPSGIAVPEFRPPTANLALFEPEAGERYFVGTVGRTWTSGTFGCVRSEGFQLHEGLDIRALERDARGEPTDDVLAAADGAVVYLNPKPALSTYGVYVVLRHDLQGWEIFTLYAHLSKIDDRLAPGTPVRCGERLGVMGRTANTRSSISRERAHLHFEVNLLLSDRFPEWHRRHYPGQRNDHGKWNGRNFLGIDPLPILLQHHQAPAKLDLNSLILQQPVLCRTLVRAAAFPWLDRYPATVQTVQHPAGVQIVAYEIHHNFMGLPLHIIPRTAQEAPGKTRFQLLDVNPEVARDFPCQKLVRQRNGRWQFTVEGERFLDLLTF
jgi:murein DD-endopeptidase MepM/ murein hydrolase activator NlpD